MTRGKLLGPLEHLVLLALLRLKDEAYGVTIRREIEARAGRSVSIGAVYTTLDRLESKGYASSFQGQPTAARGGRAKRHFRLEAKGEEALRTHADVLGRMASGLDLGWSPA